jgi:hypothetical protein
MVDGLSFHRRRVGSARGGVRRRYGWSDGGSVLLCVI